MLKILSWNIRAGGGSRLRGIVSRIISSGCSVVTLNEYRNNLSGESLRSALLKEGYRYQAVTHAAGNDNSVLIVSKIPFDSELHPSSDEIYSGNILSAHFAAFSLMGVYLPHKKKHKLLPYITDHVLQSDRPYIIAGDLNTGKNYIDQAGNSFWYTEELVKLELAGYVDAFRLVYEDISEYSWYSHQGNGYRYDHTYVSSDLLPIVKDCYYVHQWREDKLSDHSAMVLEIG